MTAIEWAKNYELRVDKFIEGSLPDVTEIQLKNQMKKELKSPEICANAAAYDITLNAYEKLNKHTAALRKKQKLAEKAEQTRQEDELRLKWLPGLMDKFMQKMPNSLHPMLKRLSLKSKQDCEAFYQRNKSNPVAQEFHNLYTTYKTRNNESFDKYVPREVVPIKHNADILFKAIVEQARVDFVAAKVMQLNHGGNLSPIGKSARNFVKIVAPENSRMILREWTKEAQNKIVRRKHK